MELEQVGPFRIVKQLGNKRQRVFEAYQDEQSRHVAIKLITLPPDVSRDHALRRIQKEVRYLQRLEHPHLTKFYGAGIVEDRVFFAMELVDGESLASILSRRGRIAWDLAIDYAIQIAQVLEYLHKQELLHSKLTPEKILVSGGQVKVTDLRLNRARRRRWDAKKREELEVAAYLAPEQLLGEGATHQSDLYSLGAIIYEMVAGKMPYPPESLERMSARKRQQKIEPLSQTVVDCPVWLDRVVEVLMHPVPQQRYPSARAAELALIEIQKIDANKTSTAAQMAGGFNALTAGADKSEARRLLGQKEPTVKQVTKKKRQAENPIYLQTWLLVIGLLTASTALGVAFYSMIPSFDAKIAQAQRILDDPNASVMDMRDAFNDLERLVQRQPEADPVDEAQQLMESLQIKRLLRLAKGGRVGLQDPLTKSFINAFQDDINGNYPESLAGFRLVIGEVSSLDPENGHMYREAIRQYLSVQKHFSENAKSGLKQAITLEDDSKALDWAVLIKQQLGNSADHQDWIQELTRRFPQIDKIDSFPAISEPSASEVTDSSAVPPTAPTVLGEGTPGALDASDNSTLETSFSQATTAAEQKAVSGSDAPNFEKGSQRSTESDAGQEQQ